MNSLVPTRKNSKRLVPGLRGEQRHSEGLMSCSCRSKPASHTLPTPTCTQLHGYGTARVIQNTNTKRGTVQQVR
ncbi:hypothetical protein CHARACLAT_005704 [Characodon lateralis]|uniref:Uncharacterized protein n=1 Tax=Characodon lateralis TaxID=208331 RepID=A0ABU7DNN5_9TELE|nr:hypothetical protein [Characodon lateralis]